ncbi:MAG: hypothetical protein NXI16_09685 [Alphaproteobacteria bacterium]|nr:hypothetical protein [Alphaproteobacteria bacterium]
MIELLSYSLMTAVGYRPEQRMFTHDKAARHRMDITPDNAPRLEGSGTGTRPLRRSEKRV